MSALVSALYGLSIPSWQAVLVWFLPGLAVGIPLAAGRLPVTYHQVWVITLSSWLLAFAGWTALGLSLPASDPVLTSLPQWVSVAALFVVGILVPQILNNWLDRRVV